MMNRPYDISAVTIGHLSRDHRTCQPLPYDISTVRPYGISAVGLDISAVTIRHFAVGLTAEMPSKVRYSGLIYKVGCFKAGWISGLICRFDLADWTHRLVASCGRGLVPAVVACCFKDKDKNSKGYRA